MKTFCCSHMEYQINEDKTLIDYLEDTRTYSFYTPNSECGTRLKMSHCPWCGVNLPKSLETEWEHVLIDDYQIDNPIENENLIPTEFKTDEWWKKRGL